MSPALDPTTVWLSPAVRQAVVQWLDSIQDVTDGTPAPRWKYNRHMLRPWAVEGTGHVVLIRQSLDALDSEWTRWVAREMQSWQDPATGRFVDPLVGPSDRDGDHHTWEHIWQHASALCAEALAALGEAPLHPLPQDVFAPLSAERVRDAVLGLEWSNPWLVGEHWSAMLLAYRRRHRIPPGAGDAALEEAFRIVETEVLDPQTGLPTRRGCADTAVATCGLFKLLFGYADARRPFPWPRQAIDSVLALQQPDGGFRDNMCVNWDAADVVRRMTAQLGGAYRRDEVIAMGNRLAAHLLAHHRKDDGAFSFFRAHCIPVHNSVRVSEPRPESDVVGTYMAVECLRYADAWRGLGTGGASA